MHNIPMLQVERVKEINLTFENRILMYTMRHKQLFSIKNSFMRLNIFWKYNFNSLNLDFKTFLYNDLVINNINKFTYYEL